MRRYKFSVAALVVATGVALSWLAGCATNEAGRHQLMLMSSQEEMQLGFTSFNQMKQQVPISKDPKANDMVQRVGKHIASVVNLPGAQWEFVVFDSKEVNAFCLPGGKIGVYTGILPIVKDDAGLATVLGHEVAHATLHHGNERMSREMLRQGIGQGLNALVSGQDPKVQALTATVYGTGTQLVETLPHSRAQESEADHLGLIYMAKAGYDPEAAVLFWQRFADYNKKAGGGGDVWFLRTHPDDGTRIKQLQQWMPEAKAKQKAAQSGSRTRGV